MAECTFKTYILYCWINMAFRIKLKYVLNNIVNINPDLKQIWSCLRAVRNQVLTNYQITLLNLETSCTVINFSPVWMRGRERSKCSCVRWLKRESLLTPPQDELQIRNNCVTYLFTFYPPPFSILASWSTVHGPLHWRNSWILWSALKNRSKNYQFLMSFISKTNN